MVFFHLTMLYYMIGVGTAAVMISQRPEVRESYATITSENITEFGKEIVLYSLDRN